MKSFLFIAVCFLGFHMEPSAQIISERGYPEHFIVGAIIGGGTSYLVYKKTDHKFKSWGIGFGASVAAGLVKELVDPVIFNGTRSTRDVVYTVLGGAFGASIVFPIGRKKK